MGDFSMSFLTCVGLDPNGSIPDLLFMGFQVRINFWNKPFFISYRGTAKLIPGI